MEEFKKEFYWHEKKIIFDKHGITFNHYYRDERNFYFTYEELKRFEYSKLGNTICVIADADGEEHMFVYSTLNWNQRELKQVLKLVKAQMTGAEIKKTTFDFWGKQGSWFQLAFSLCAFLLAFSVLLKCGAAMTTVIAIAIMLTALGFGISLYLDVHLFHDMESKKAITRKIVICIVMLIITLLTLVGNPGSSSSAHYDT